MSWSGWIPHQTQGENLYLDWFFSQGGDQASNRGSISAGGLVAGKPRIDLPHVVGKLSEEFGDFFAPSFAKSDHFDLARLNEEWVPPDSIPDLEPDTVIVGIIDTGIALGHRRTRLDNGETRFLAAWQQAAEPESLEEFRKRSGSLSEELSLEEAKELLLKRSNLPSGRELLADDINRLLDEHSTGGLQDGWLNEESFNQAAGLVDFRNIDGHRLLARHAAHGSHILDRAVGYDPKIDSNLARKTRIIAINLPPRGVVGLSGSFLELYVVMGIARIVEIADGFAKRATEKPSNGKYYPIIINLSFGKQAGPRDGSTIIERFVSTINSQRVGQNERAVDKGTVYLTMPAGNDNLLRSNAIVPLSGNSIEPLQWRVLPEDQSSNYVEIWSGKIDKEKIKDDKIPLQISIETPDGSLLQHGPDENLARIIDEEKILFAQIEIQPNEGENVQERKTPSRVYLQIRSHKKEENGKIKVLYRFHYLICVAPTLTHDVEFPAAPAGIWKIFLKNGIDDEITVFANIQTDQSAMPDGTTGLRSKFEDETYQRFDKTTGRPLDTYAYPDQRAITRRSDLGNDQARFIKRHGTLNALGGANSIYGVVAAGYRATDGAPARYSASGVTGAAERLARGAPTLALVTEDGPAHPGILSAGSRDGSVVAMRGTSFAASQMTREIVELLVPKKANGKGKTDLDPKAPEQQSVPDSFDRRIEENEKKFPSKADIEKVGRGRYPQSHYRGMNRLGLEETDV